MKLLYWPDFDCTEETRRIAVPDTVHVHGTNEEELARKFIEFTERHAQLHAAGMRYHCFRGPGGLIRGVEDE